MTSVLASYRGYDTLGETTVIFTALVGALLLLTGNPAAWRAFVPPRPATGSSPPPEGERMDDRVILRVGAKMMIPFILLFALYVQFHGDYGPGGGFQAAVIAATAFILYALVFGLDAAKLVLPPGVVYVTAALGVLIFAAVGVAALLQGGRFLEYAVLLEGSKDAQVAGIMLVELGVLVTVFGVMVAIFYVFAGRTRIQVRP
ncbi:MAG: Na(+)/H(+) antiporter subunit B [Gemmatimonadales bacterium]